MRAALSARVSTSRQALAQTITDQVTRLREHIRQQGWTLDATHVFRDDGYSGASLTRPGLDALRDQAALAAFDVVVLTAPDRLARKYIHQVLLLEELAGLGSQVLFVDRPMSQGPHDQLLLQIRGAVAEYERTLITERMRRGRQAKIRAGQLLPWTRPPFGYRADPERPRAAAALEIDPVAAVVVRQVFAWYLEPQATLYGVAARLTASVIATPAGRAGPRPASGTCSGIMPTSARRTPIAPGWPRRAAAGRPSPRSGMGRDRCSAPRPSGSPSRCRHLSPPRTLPSCRRSSARIRSRRVATTRATSTSSVPW